ncbi:MAG: hypothetical protein IKZ21_03825 [Clostridia bacterium]|nr:hypothetical protein [Clostridia bacterium]
MDWILVGERTQITVLGMELSLSFEIMYLLAQMLLAPLELGVASYYLRGSRGDPGSMAGPFLWYAKRDKLKIAGKYSLWQLGFRIVTFPIGVLPIYYLNQELDRVLAEATNAGLFVETIAVDTRGISMALVLLAIFGLVSLPFAALPYMLCDIGNRGLFKCVKYSVKLMLSILPQYLLLLAGFIPWILAGSCLFFIYIFLVVYYRLATVCLMDYARSNIAREPYYKDFARKEETES